MATFEGFTFSLGLSLVAGKAATYDNVDWNVFFSDLLLLQCFRANVFVLLLSVKFNSHRNSLTGVHGILGIAQLCFLLL